MSTSRDKEGRKPPLVILAGPTAVGKTRISIELARRIGGEIISADSMQVYRGMDIGSAKITEAEMEGVPHHLIDILSPWEEFNVVVFQRRCLEAMEAIYSRGHMPILTGGTGFYIQAVLRGIDFTENKENTACRRKLEKLAGEAGGEVLHRMLERVDPASAAKIPAQNVKRMIRALEYYEQTGEPISVHNEREAQKEAAYQSCFFVLTDARERLYEQIDRRVDTMMEKGLVEEVRALQGRGCHREMVSMQGLGYKEILDYLEGRIHLEEAIYRIKRDTRHFAKRQLTWFKREKEVIWVDKSLFERDEEAIIQYMAETIRERIGGGDGFEVNCRNI